MSVMSKRRERSRRCALVAATLMIMALIGAPKYVLADLRDTTSCIVTGTCIGFGKRKDVDPTGVVHEIYLVGDTFFPDIVHLDYGDEILFVNMLNRPTVIIATDASWRSILLHRNASWGMVVQPRTRLSFREISILAISRGELRISPPPPPVDYGKLIDEAGNVIGKDGSFIRAAEGPDESYTGH